MQLRREDSPILDPMPFESRDQGVPLPADQRADPALLPDRKRSK